MPSSLTFQLHITKTTVFSDHAIYYFHINIAIFHKINFSTSLRKPSSIGRNKAQFQSKQHKFKVWIVQVLKSTFLGTLFFFNPPPQPHTHIHTLMRHSIYHRFSFLYTVGIKYLLFHFSVVLAIRYIDESKSCVLGQEMCVIDWGLRYI